MSPAAKGKNQSSLLLYLSLLLHSAFGLDIALSHLLSNGDLIWRSWIYCSPSACKHYICEQAGKSFFLTYCLVQWSLFSVMQDSDHHTDVSWVPQYFTVFHMDASSWIHFLVEIEYLFSSFDRFFGFCVCAFHSQNRKISKSHVSNQI